MGSGERMHESVAWRRLTTSVQAILSACSCSVGQLAEGDVAMHRASRRIACPLIPFHWSVG